LRKVELEDEKEPGEVWDCEVEKSMELAQDGV
jgi:hypothetical protein